MLVLLFEQTIEPIAARISSISNNNKNSRGRGRGRSKNDGRPQSGITIRLCTCFRVGLLSPDELYPNNYDSSMSTKTSKKFGMINDTINSKIMGMAHDATLNTRRRVWIACLCCVPTSSL